jgi:LruC domain-containing protein
MNKKVSIFICISLIVLTSCVKMPESKYEPEFEVLEDFDWKTIEQRAVTLADTSIILNESGDTVAVSMPPGTYDLIVGKNSTLTAIRDTSTSNDVLTKSPGDKYKQVVYFPSKNKYSTLMFEDLFPSKGDMDMNDIVFGINLEFYLDNQSRLRAFKINVQPRAVGSSYQAIALAASLSGGSYDHYVDKIYYSTESLNGFFNVTSYGDSYSAEMNNIFDVIPLTGNFRGHFADNTELFLNVRNIDPVIATQNFWVYVDIHPSRIFSISQLSLISPPAAGMVNLDIFALVESRGKEIHFKGTRPTGFFYYPYFVATRPRADFSSPDNWVWAILSDQSIQHPQEFSGIYLAYPGFSSWTSGGSSGWYTPAVDEYLYTKKSF